MATAGRPASPTPWTARSTSSVGNVGLNAVATVKTETASSEAVIIDLRPTDSESVPANRSETASVAAVTDSDRLAVAGETWNSAANVGSSGWVAYNAAKVTKPP